VRVFAKFIKLIGKPCQHGRFYMYINMDVTRGKVWIQGKHFLFISLVMIFAGSAQAGIE